MKKTIAYLLTATMMIGCLASCSNGSESSSSGSSNSSGEAENQEVIHISFGHDNLPGEPLTEAAEYWAQRLEEVSGGTMIIDVYDSSSLGSKSDLLDQVAAVSESV